MRVAFLTMGREIGGAAQDILTLSRGLVDLGHKVFVISEKGVMDRELEGSGVEFIEAPLYTRNILGLWRASIQIRKHANHHRIEIMNPQGMFTALSAWLATIGGKSQFRVITTIHMISDLRLYKFAWVLNTFSDKIITESNCERNRLVSGGAKRKKIEVISNSVDTERFSPEQSKPVLRQEYNIAQDQCCFGIVARLSAEKRHVDFIEAARMVHTEYPQTTFFIIGDGLEREIVTESIKGAEDYIIMTGMRRDIPDVLRSLDCFVLSSEQESLPLSIREAMSMGLPVIATDVGGVREAVLQGITGYVVPAKKPEKLAEAMIKIVTDGRFGQSLGESGQELCRRNFELKTWSRKTEALFQSF